MIATTTRLTTILEDKAQLEAQLVEGLKLIPNEKLREAAAHIISAGGKRIRPALMSMAYKAAGGADVSAVMPIAAAMEFVHNWTLVHDDIIDKSDTRRGQPTVHKKWDETVAILAGDMLNNLAYRMVANSAVSKSLIAKVTDELANASMEVMDGEQMDVDFESRESISEQEYFTMIGKKTGALFSASARMGAMIATSDEDIISSLEVYGEKVGLAFQIQDDLLDILGDLATFGKEIGKDIKEGKKTLMVIHCLSKPETKYAQRLAKILSSTPATDVQVLEAIEILDESGSLDYGQLVLNKLVKEAQQALEVLPASHYKTALIELADYIANRNRSIRLKKP
ncbi:polyprenyl synthetase family protein [soil metagenome]